MGDYFKQVETRNLSIYSSLNGRLRLIFQPNLKIWNNIYKNYSSFSKMGANFRIYYGNPCALCYIFFILRNM